MSANMPSFFASALYTLLLITLGTAAAQCAFRIRSIYATTTTTKRNQAIIKPKPP